MLNMSIGITGVAAVQAALQALAAHIINPAEFLQDIAVPYLKKDIRRAFQSRGYRTWQPLAESTIRQKTRQGYPSTPLVRTGRYQRATESLRGLRVRRNVLELDSPIPYAVYHEFGTRRMPARPVFSLVTRRLERELPRLFDRWVQRRIRREFS